MAAAQTSTAPTPPEQQIETVRQVASLIYDYRDHPARFTRFEMKCGMSFGRHIVSGIVSVSPSRKDEQFVCKDEELLEVMGNERDAFFEAIDVFASHDAALAWNGKSPTKNFNVPREMSLNFAHPTMHADLVFRRKGEADETALRMLFIAFQSPLAASIYASKRPGLLK